MLLLGNHNVPPVTVIPTGCISIDAALGVGGFPRGRVVEMVRPESSGRTTLALHLIASAQKAGGYATFIDAEHALDLAGALIASGTVAVSRTKSECVSLRAPM